MRQLFALLTVIILGCSVPVLAAGLVYDPSTGSVIKQQGNDHARSIASLTKIMTAMVVLDSGVALSETVQLDSRNVGILRPGRYSRLELLHALLINSDNAAAETLAVHHPQGRSKFIYDMNAKAKQLMMYSSRFADASGLSVFNVSTMHEVGIMIAHAGQYELIRSISTLATVEINRQQLYNTGAGLLSRVQNPVVTKTGFTNHAGFCVGIAMIYQGRELVVVVLGAPSRQTRIATVDQLIKGI